MAIEAGTVAAALTHLSEPLITVLDLTRNGLANIFSEK